MSNFFDTNNVNFFKNEFGYPNEWGKTRHTVNSFS